MNFKAIAGEHTLDLDLLRGGWVLDVGARGFEFATEMVSNGCYVISLDPSRDVSNPKIKCVSFMQSALSACCENVDFNDWGNGSGSHVVGTQTTVTGGSVYTVSAINIEMLMKLYNLSHFDAVKLDCEGAEYSILTNWPGPVATQVTVAFHDFITPGDFSKHDAAVSRLKEWYKPIQDEPSVRHGHAPPCHWDSLYVLK